MKRVFIGLGNPGKKYSHTRHNAGALLLKSLLVHFDLKLQKDTRALSELAQGFWDAADEVESGERERRELFFLRPQSYMNLSGASAQRVLQKFQLKPQEILVLHDETELPFGEIRFKQGGGHGGHNGLRDIMAHIGPDFSRLRLGVGRPEQGLGLADYLLSDFSKEEQEQFPSFFSKAQELCLDWLRGKLS